MLYHGQCPGKQRLYRHIFLVALGRIDSLGREGYASLFWFWKTILAWAWSWRATEMVGSSSSRFSFPEHLHKSWERMASLRSPQGHPFCQFTGSPFFSFVQLINPSRHVHSPHANYHRRDLSPSLLLFFKHTLELYPSDISFQPHWGVSNCLITNRLEARGPCIPPVLLWVPLWACAAITVKGQPGLQCELWC